MRLPTCAVGVLAQMMRCEICGKLVKLCGLGTHVTLVHRDEMSPQEYYDAYVAKPGEGICATCGKPTKFYGIARGYALHCSMACAAKDPSRQEKIKATMLERHGVTNAYLIPDVKARAQANSHTESAVKKMMATKLERYGYEAPWQDMEIHAKAMAAQAKTTEKRVKAFRETLDKFEEENDCTGTKKLVRMYGQGWLHFKDELGLSILHKGQYSFVSNDDIWKIEKYASESIGNSSMAEKHIVEFIKDVYCGEVIENSRQVIKPRELDIYIPEKKLAIEFNGDYWHSEDVGTPKFYHLEKTKMCEDAGIRLIHISELEWAEKREICESLIKSALGIYEKRVYARSCEVREVGSGEARAFLDANHVQGHVRSSSRFGLYKDDELLQIICIGKSRFKRGEVELLRMCSKLGVQAAGGFSKLMARQPYDELVSYVDRSKFSGVAYTSSGWELVGETPPSYRYWKVGELAYVSRFEAQKHKLANLLGDAFNPELTEHENMRAAGYCRVYDCGNLKMRWRRGDERGQ